MSRILRVGTNLPHRTKGSYFFYWIPATPIESPSGSGTTYFNILRLLDAARTHNAHESRWKLNEWMTGAQYTVAPEASVHEVLTVSLPLLVESLVMNVHYRSMLNGYINPVGEVKLMCSWPQGRVNYTNRAYIWSKHTERKREFRNNKNSRWGDHTWQTFTGEHNAIGCALDAVMGFERNPPSMIRSLELTIPQWMCSKQMDRERHKQETKTVSRW